MRTLLLIALLLGGCLFCRAQEGTIKLYGFRQVASPGVRPEITADGLEKEPVSASPSPVNYYIYLTHPAGVRVYPVAMWIEGEAYGVKPEAVTELPQMTAGGNGTEEAGKTKAAPLAAGTALRLVPTEYIPGKDRPAAALIKENEVVVLYRQGGKMHTQTVKKLQELPGAARP